MARTTVLCDKFNCQFWKVGECALTTLTVMGRLCNDFERKPVPKGREAK